VNGDPNRICLGLKVISYKDSNGTPALTQDGANSLVQQINQIWQTCNIGFQIEEYQAIDPAASGLSYGSNSENELTQIRDTFANNSTFLVVATGPWTTSAIAWTEMPGAPPYGTVVDSDFANDPIAVGHELGHYMGLDHVNDMGNLLYPVVYSSNTNLTADQCNTTRSTDQSYWQGMMRN
jgi:hypothetical protein